MSQLGQRQCDGREEGWRPTLYLEIAPGNDLEDPNLHFTRAAEEGRSEREGNVQDVYAINDHGDYEARTLSVALVELWVVWAVARDV